MGKSLKLIFKPVTIKWISKKDKKKKKKLEPLPLRKIKQKGGKMRKIFNGKKGQTAVISLMIGVFVFMLALVFIHPLADVISESKSVDQLDCENSSISDGKKLTCLVVDLTLPYFIIIIVAIAGGYFGAKLIV